MKIIVDADATPRSCLAICRKEAARQHFDLITVASFDHRMETDGHRVVGDGPQEADMKIINLCRPGDIVVTQDWGLAALALGKGAAAISPLGRVYRSETIQFLLECRDQSARLRRGGGRTKGPKKRVPRDDYYFRENLRRLIGRESPSEEG